MNEGIQEGEGAYHVQIRGEGLVRDQTLHVIEGFIWKHSCELVAHYRAHESRHVLDSFRLQEAGDRRVARMMMIE